MTIRQIYELAVSLGMKNDLRGEQTVRKRLKKEQDRYAKLSRREKEEYDEERLNNPYADTRIYVKDPKKQVKRILVGIDTDTGEMMLTHELSKTKPIDLYISHHPIGSALAGLHEVMDMQAEILSLYGVPINIAQGLLHLRIEEVSRKLSPGNHYQELDAAKHLGVDVMTCHTASDNMVATYLKRLIAKKGKELETVGDVMELLKGIPEYKTAARMKMGPRMFAGKKENFAGNIVLTEITGGTEGSSEVYKAMANAGISTIVSMHQSEEHQKKAEESHMNVIIAGHMSSDSIGLNLFLDELEKRGIEVLSTAGLIRHSRSPRKRKPKRKTTRKR